MAAALSSIMKFIVFWCALGTAAGLRKTATSQGQQGVKVDGRYFVILELYDLQVAISESKSNPEAISDFSRNLAHGLAHAGDKAPALLEVDETSRELESTAGLFHSEVTLCDRNTMSSYQIDVLSESVNKIGMFSSYQWVEPNFWYSQSASRVNCTTLSFGGSKDPDNCSGVSDFAQRLSDVKAGIGNYYVDDATHVKKYVYGTTDDNAYTVKQRECDACGPNWSGTSYNAVTRNCNYWSKTILGCQLNLYSGLPWLHVSDIRPRLWCGC